jgi:hypothetical protein
VSIAEAVQTGRAFSVQLALHVLGIDLDEPERAVFLDCFAKECVARGLQPVIEESGRPGHRHLLVAVHDGRLRSELTAMARSLGLRVATSLRPPLTPHRLGCPVRLLQPESEEEALQALQPRARRQLPPRLERLLREGDTDGDTGRTTAKPIAHGCWLPWSLATSHGDGPSTKHTASSLGRSTAGARSGKTT